MSTGGTPAPTTAPKHPVLQNLGKLLLKYGPVLLQWLLSSGIIKLPPGVTLPPLPTPGSQADPAAMAALEAIEPEVDHEALHNHLSVMHGLAAEASYKAAT